MAKLALLMFVLMCALGLALPPDYAAIGVLMFALGYNAHDVLALAWRAHRAKVRAPRSGALVHLHRSYGPQAVRKQPRLARDRTVIRSSGVSR